MSFPDKMDKYLSQKEVSGISGEKILLGGNSMSTINNLKTINNLFAKIKPNKTLEIGLCHAASAVLFASLHEKENRSDFYHYSMDPYQIKGWDSIGLEQLKKFELDKLVKFYPDYSYNVLPQLLKENIKFDIIYIDGSHLFENAFIDFFYSINLLEVGGYILFDDSTDPNIRKLLRFIRLNYKNILKEINVLNYLEKSSFEKVKYLLAKKFNKTQLSIFRKIIEDVERPWYSAFHNF